MEKQAAYSETDLHTWSILFNRQREAVEKYAYAKFLPSLDALKLSANFVPTLDFLNTQLFPLTGWKLYPVPGLIDNQYFFEQMTMKLFGSTTWLRKPEQLDYLEEPDMFHDVFGHIPLLADENITSFLVGLADIAAESNYNEEVVEAVSRLYWYTVEFGLVRENHAVKIIGAGILSSIGETAYCMSEKVQLKNFDVPSIINTAYIKDSFQEYYFVLNNVNDLKNFIPSIRKELGLQVLPTLNN